MSAPSPSMRRADRAMTNEQMQRLLDRGYAGRLATVSEDGSPYCTPLLFVWADNRVFLHGTSARGHLQSNVRRDPRACFVIDEPGDVFDYGPLRVRQRIGLWYAAYRRARPPTRNSRPARSA